MGDNTDYRGINQDVMNACLSYIDMDSPEFAILINGDWGCGKTHLIKCVEEQVNSKMDVVNLSMYGINNKEELKNKIVLELLGKGKIKDIYNITAVKNLAELANKTFKKRAGFTLDWQLVAEMISKKIGEDTLLIIDDIERSNINIIELMGTLYDYVMIKKVKVIIVGNENELIKLNSHYIQGYKVQKEKLVAYTYNVVADYNQALKSFIKSNLTDYYEEIQDAVRITGTNNLRLVKRAIDYVGLLINKIKPIIKTYTDEVQKEYIAGIIKYYTSLYIQYNCGYTTKWIDEYEKLKDRQIKDAEMQGRKIDNAIIEIMGDKVNITLDINNTNKLGFIMQATTVNMSLIEYIKNPDKNYYIAAYLWQSIPIVEMWEDIIIKGLIDDQKLEVVITANLATENIELDTLNSLVKNWMAMDVTELKNKINLLKKEFAEFKYTDPIEITQICHFMLNMKQLEIIPIELDELVSELNHTIENMQEKSVITQLANEHDLNEFTFNSKFYYSGYVDMGDENQDMKKKYVEIYKHFIDKMYKTAINIKRTQIKKEFEKAIEKIKMGDIDGVDNIISQYDHGINTSVYNYYPVLCWVKAKDLFYALSKIQIKEQKRLISYLVHDRYNLRYSNPHINEGINEQEVEEEYKNILKLKALYEETYRNSEQYYNAKLIGIKIILKDIKKATEFLEETLKKI